MKPCFISTRITDIFYFVDEFCKEFDKAKGGHVLNEKESKKTRNSKFIRCLIAKKSPPNCVPSFTNAVPETFLYQLYIEAYAVLLSRNSILQSVYRTT